MGAPRHRHVQGQRQKRAVQPEGAGGEQASEGALAHQILEEAPQAGLLLLLAAFLELHPEVRGAGHHGLHQVPFPAELDLDDMARQVLRIGIGVLAQGGLPQRVRRGGHDVDIADEALQLKSPRARHGDGHDAREHRQGLPGVPGARCAALRLAVVRCGPCRGPRRRLRGLLAGAGGASCAQRALAPLLVIGLAPVGLAQFLVGFADAREEARIAPRHVGVKALHQLPVGGPDLLCAG